MGITMKKSIVISMALFAFAFEANASVVSLSRAKNVARSWLVREGKASNVQAISIQRADVIRVPELGDDAKYFAVKIKDGGTVVTSSDDEASPVVLFSDSAEEIDFSDVNSPAYSLLRKDYQIRKRADVMASEAKEKPQVSNDYRFYLDRRRMLDRNREEWARLSGDSYQLDDCALNPGLAWYGRDDWFIKIFTASSLYDIRINPLVQSRWNQSTVSVNGQTMACYNYYTPNKKNPLDQYGFAGNPDNVVCGCVATALAQILRYFAYDGTVECVNGYTNQTFDCMYEDSNIKRKLQGGTYDWEKMTLVPAMSTATDPFTSTNAMEIGKLCADCGTAVEMMYGESGSGAYSSKAFIALTQYFGYSSARWYSNGHEIGSAGRDAQTPVEPEEFPDTRAAALQRVFYSNFDAGLPILLGLTGHEVVADGYGYSKDGLDYVHINMGWGGQCDLWYLLPNVSCDSNGRPEGNLMFFEDCAYNIFTTNAATDVVMSGRVVDDDDNPIAGASVKICRPGDHDNPVAEFVTGDNGIWGLVIAPGNYEVVASSEFATESETFSVLDNRWGCDIRLAPMAVRNLMQLAPTNEYTSLEKAILAANTNDVLEVFARTRLKKSVTIDRNLTIKIDSGHADDPTNCLIRVSNSSVITVAPGVRAEFGGLAFVSDAETVINVETNGVAAFSGMLGVGTIRTADAEGFELAGAIDYIDGFELFVKCAVASKKGQKFGVWTCPDGDKASAGHILNPENLDLGGVAVDGGSLVWGVVPVDPRLAVAYVDDGSGSLVYYRTLESLFEYNPSGDLDIKLTKDVSGFNLQPSVDVSGRKISISSDGGPFTISGIVAKSGGFRVGTGGELTLEGVTLDGFKGPWFVQLPENGGTFTLGENAQLRNFIVVDASDSGDCPKGIIGMLGGKMVMCENSLISDSAFMGGVGSVISLFGGELDVDGGSIIGCVAEQGGGAIYYYPYIDGTVLNLSGNVDIFGNQINDTNARGPGNIYIGTADAVINVIGDITSTYGIGVHHGLNDVSNAFANVVGSLSNPGVFVHDLNGRMKKPLAAILDGSSVLWDYAEDTFGQCDPAEATVTVTCGEGDRYYADIATALNHLTGDATIVLNADQRLHDEALVSHMVNIDGAGYRIIRDGLGEIKVATDGDLTLENVQVAGYDYESPWYYYVVGAGYLYAEFRGSNHQIIEVDGGKLTLGSGAEICYLGYDQVTDRLWDETDPQLYALFMEYGQLIPAGAYILDDYYRSSCAVVVWNGGELVMESGAEIHDCWNYYYEDPVNLGVTAGILVEEGTAHLNGGRIYRCVASLASAMNACQGVNGYSIIHLGGDFTMSGNINRDGGNSNFVLEDLSKLYLDSTLSGSIGYTPGYFADQEKVCEVITNLTPEEVSDSAAHFINDKTGARAVVVRGDSGCLIVWSTAISADNNYYEVCSNGVTNVWAMIGSEIPKSLARYRFATNFTYNAAIHSAVIESTGCELVSGFCATNAGTYTCKLKPVEGFAWIDDTVDVKTFEWTINPSPLYIYPEKGQGRYFILPLDQIAEHEPKPFRFTAGTFYGGDSIANTLTGEISHEFFGQNVWAISHYTIGTLECTNSNYVITEETFNPEGQYFYIDQSRTNDYSVANSVNYGRPNPSDPIPVTFKQLRSLIGGSMFFAVEAPVGAVFNVMWTESLAEEFKLLKTVVISEDSVFEVAPDESMTEHPAGFFKIVPVK